MIPGEVWGLLRTAIAVGTLWIRCRRSLAAVRLRSLWACQVTLE